MEAAAEAAEAAAELLLGLLLLLPPILTVNTYGKTEAVKIKGAFRNRPRTIITGIKQAVRGRFIE